MIHLIYSYPWPTDFELIFKDGLAQFTTLCNTTKKLSPEAEARKKITRTTFICSNRTLVSFDVCVQNRQTASGSGFPTQSFQSLQHEIQTARELIAG
jgi:hypothetical protein